LTTSKAGVLQVVRTSVTREALRIHARRNGINPKGSSQRIDIWMLLCIVLEALCDVLLFLPLWMFLQISAHSAAFMLPCCFQAAATQYW
jgi:hypothetical protein